MNIYKKILELFICDDNYRPWMKKPFFIDEFVYSTNGVFLCKIHEKYLEKKDFTEKEEKEKIVKIFPIERNLNFKILVSDLRMKLDKVMKNVKINCEKCEECNGTGKVEWTYKDYEKVDDCPCCDSFGNIEAKEVYFVDILNCRLNLSRIDLILKTATMLKVKEITILSQEKEKTLIKIGNIELITMGVFKHSNDDGKVVFKYV